MTSPKILDLGCCRCQRGREDAATRMFFVRESAEDFDFDQPRPAQMVGPPGIEPGTP